MCFLFIVSLKFRFFLCHDACSYSSITTQKLNQIRIRTGSPFLNPITVSPYPTILFCEGVVYRHPINTHSRHILAGDMKWVLNCETLNSINHRKITVRTQKRMCEVVGRGCLINTAVSSRASDGRIHFKPLFHCPRRAVSPLKCFSCIRSW